MSSLSYYYRPFIIGHVSLQFGYLIGFGHIFHGFQSLSLYCIRWKLRNERLEIDGNFLRRLFFYWPLFFLDVMILNLISCFSFSSFQLPYSTHSHASSQLYKITHLWRCLTNWHIYYICTVSHKNRILITAGPNRARI